MKKQMQSNVKAGEVLKKMLCIILATIMLACNFSTPVNAIVADMNSSDESSIVQEDENTETEETAQNGRTNQLNKNLSTLRMANNTTRAQSNDNFEVKTKNDQHEIRTFGMEFVSGAELDENNNLVWTAGSSAKGHEFTFRVSYALSGLREFPAESITMKIPKSILRNRDRELDDRFIMSLPTKEEYKGTTELAYIEDDENLIIYNPREVPAGLNGYFEITYATTSETFEYRDYDPSNTDLITNGGTASDPFYATIEVKSGTDTLRDITDKENVYINTTAYILSTQKIYPDIYQEWQNGWTAEAPADKDDYYYLLWTIRTHIATPTQPYNFSLEDVIEDQTEGLNGEDYEIVGYKLSGERFFTNNTKVYNQRMAGYRYDYVLTRHKISTYRNLKYQLKNSETATVDPIDQVDEDTSASSSNIFFWDPHFEPPIGSFDLYKYGNNSGFNGTYSSYELDQFQRKEIDKLGGFRFKTEVSGYQYPWTVRDEDSIAYPESYGKVDVNYETWDDTLYLEEDTRPLSTEDYYLSALDFELECEDVTYNNFEMKFEAKFIRNFVNDEIITFYAKFNGNQEWIQVAQYNCKDGSNTINRDYVSSINNNSIIFKPDVHATGWKYTTSNNYYYVNITTVPHYVLYDSEYVMDKIKDKDAIRLENHVNTYITDYKNRKLFEREKDAIDYARTIDSSSDIQKRITTASNNVVDKSYDITWEVRMEEPIKGSSGLATEIEQQSGRFYDLIPAGGEVDVSSIQVRNQQRALSENEYTYELIQNYKNSGRTMLVISINTPGTQYLAYYKTIHSWASIKDFGRHVLNPVAYETGNEKISDGYPDDGGKLSEENKALYVDLDKTTDAKKFIYTQSTYDINALTATTSGLFKKVKNSKETTYSYDTITEPDGIYSYQWRYENTLANKSKNLIFFDSLENFKIIDSKAGTVETSSWRGTLQSIDISQIRSKGINPIVYISTKEDLNLEQFNDLTDTSVWKVVTPTTNLSQAKAIAIDMRKDNNGNDFVLGAGESLTATIYMKAPGSIPEEHEYNPYTYNNIYIKNELIDELDQTKKYFIHQDYTRVKYHIIADIPGLKVNARDNTEGVSGITFRLYGTSIYGTQVDEYQTTGPQGNFIFKDIEVGEYILQESEGTPDWLADYTEHRVRITRDRKVYVDDNLVTKSEPVILQNKPRIHTDIKFNKISTEHDINITGAKFKLSGISKYGTEVTEYATSNNGIVEFLNIEYGTYDMTEVKTAEGYIPNKEKYKVVVDENGNYRIQSAANQENTAVTFDNEQYRIYNEPYHKVNFQKKDEYSEEVIEGAKFKLYGTSDYGNSYNQEAISTSMGFVNFDGVEAGTYLLEEMEPGKTTDAQGNEITYVLDTNKYVVTVEKNGNFTIEGFEKDQYGNYVLNNKRNKGQITITKEWLDESNNDERPEPEIHISSTKPEKVLTAQYLRDGYYYWWEEYSEYTGMWDEYEEYYGPLYHVDSEYRNKITGTFARNKSLSEDEVKALGATRIDKDYEDENAEYKIYGWIDDSGNFWWWSNADVMKITDNSKNIFQKLSKVKNIDLSYIDTSELEDMKGLFVNCYELTSLNVSTLDTSNATIMNGMFSNCRNLTSLDVSTFDTSNVTNMGRMFYGCSSLLELNISNLDTSNVTNMYGMFQGCSSLTELDLSDWNTSNVTDMENMFSDCSSLTEVDLTNIDTSSVTDMEDMFYGCSELTELDLTNFNTSSVRSMYGMFAYCEKLTELDLSSFNTSNVTDMGYMFIGCSSLEKLDLTSFNTSSVSSMYTMFSGCEKLTELDLSSFDISNTNNFNEMFDDCINLKTIYTSDSFDISDGDWGLFENCTSLIGGNGTTFVGDRCSYARIDKPGQPGYFTEKAPTPTSNTSNTSNAQNNENNLTNETETNDNSNQPVEYSTKETNHDDQGNEVHWVKDGNIWTYTFYVDDPNATWYVWEEPVPDGYTANYTIENPGIATAQKATIRNYTPQKETLAQFGDLKISKKLIERSSESERELTVADDNKEFTFKVTLTANAGNESLISGTKVFGSYVFKNGVATVKLHAGEETTITDIPAGVSYSVTENAVNGYEVFAGSEGTIIADNVSEVNAVNYKNATSQSSTPGETVEEDKFTSITITKKVTGNSEVQETCEIYVALNNLKPETTYSLSNGTIFTSDSEGSADVELVLGNDDSVTIQNIPVGSKYKAYEVAGDYISSYEIKDANNMRLINNTADLNSKSNTAISTKTETADDGEAVTITFTNKKIVTQNLKIQKNAINEDDKNSYIFNIELSNMEEGYSFNSTVGKITANSRGMVTLTVYLAGGESVELFDIPVGTKYKITELASGSIASYTIVDANGGNNIVTSSGANDVARKELSTELETINQGEEVTVIFTNDTTNQEPDSVSDTIEISKTMLKANGEVFEDCSEEFTFELVPENENNPMPENNTVTIAGNGTANFGTIIFDKTGTYTYKVIEKPGDIDYYYYDNTEFIITYDVINPEGLLEITRTIKKNGFDSDVIDFTNKISKLDVTIKKEDEDENSLEGANLQIIDSEGNVVKEWITTNEESNPITIKLAPGTYTLHEVEAPSGYELADDIEFVVNDDGSVSVDGEVAVVVIMKDPKDKQDEPVEPVDPEEPSEPENPEQPDEPTKTDDEKEQEKPSKQEDSKTENKEEVSEKTEEKPNKVKEIITNAQTGDKVMTCIAILAVAGIVLFISFREKGEKN